MHVKTGTSRTLQLAHRLWGVVRLLRPINLVLIVTGVVVGGILTQGAEALFGNQGIRLLVAAVSAAMVGGSANAFNDIVDVPIDRINRPARPLAAGLVSRRLAWTAVGICGAMGLALALQVSSVHGAIAAATLTLLVLYSLRLKYVPIAGNFVVAVVLGAALVYGGLVVGSAWPSVVGACFAFLTTLGREVIKDVEDTAGDSVGGARTLPIVFGVRAAVGVATAVVLLTVLLTPVPYLFLHFGGLYLLLVLVADVLMMWALWLLATKPPDQSARRSSRLLKAAMAVGLAALATGAAP